jgi:hypothetical protein
MHGGMLSGSSSPPNGVTGDARKIFVKILADYIDKQVLNDYIEINHRQHP